MRWWRDPFFHFLLFGTVLFAGHTVWAALSDRADYRIVVDAAEINRLAGLYAVENVSPPGETELNAIILSHVEEAVLAREAKRLGLDEDDTVIRRRLAQKMRLVADSQTPAEPTDAELRTWFETNRDDYRTPESRTMQHVFFSDENREDTRADAASADLSDWRTTGDPFITTRDLGSVTQSKLQRDFGEAFSQAAFETPIGEWSAPVRSPFGMHRVRAISATDAVEPSFGTARPQVLADWNEQARREASAQAIRDMMSRYDVVVTE